MPVMGLGTTLFVAEAKTSCALQSFFSTAAVHSHVPAAQGVMLSKLIAHQLQKSPLQTLKYAISAQKCVSLLHVFTCSFISKDLSRTDTAFEMPLCGTVIEFPALADEGTIIFWISFT